MRNEVPIHTTEVNRGGGAEQESTHPAFGQISISRSQGGRGVLYDSDFRHSHQITLRIHTSKLRRHLSRDWHFPEKQLVEVTMSEAQWATFVSSMNMGSGVCCTLNYIDGEYLPAIPAAVDRSKQFRSEIDEDVQELLSALDKLDEGIKGSGLSKTKAENLLGLVRRARQQVDSSIPFVAEQFTEHMEDVVERAKQEVNGYVSGVAQQMGITAISGGQFLQLANHTDDENG